MDQEPLKKITLKTNKTSVEIADSMIKVMDKKSSEAKEPTNAGWVPAPMTFETPDDARSYCVAQAKQKTVSALVYFKLEDGEFMLPTFVEFSRQSPAQILATTIGRESPFAFTLEKKQAVTGSEIINVNQGKGKGKANMVEKNKAVQTTPPIFAGEEYATNDKMIEERTNLFKKLSKRNEIQEAFNLPASGYHAEELVYKNFNIYLDSLSEFPASVYIELSHSPCTPFDKNPSNNIKWLPESCLVKLIRLAECHKSIHFYIGYSEKFGRFQAKKHSDSQVVDYFVRAANFFKVMNISFSALEPTVPKDKVTAFKEPEGQIHKKIAVKKPKRQKK